MFKRRGGNVFTVLMTVGMILFVAFGLVSIRFGEIKEVEASGRSSAEQSLDEQAKQQKRIADTLEDIHKELKKIRMEID
jgi:hypothetical protein